MNNKLYSRILIGIVAVGLVLTVAHIAYAAYAYRDASIIYFVTKEWW